jgi:hypothetical protein
MSVTADSVRFAVGVDCAASEERFQITVLAWLADGECGAQKIGRGKRNTVLLLQTPDDSGLRSQNVGLIVQRLLKLRVCREAGDEPAFIRTELRRQIRQQADPSPVSRCTCR